jgi:uncharacterized protein (DUF1501 family)
MSAHEAYTTRRSFLTRSLALVSSSATLPVFLGTTAQALAAPRRKAADDSQPILVVVQLAGGNDGLNTVVPYGNSLYYHARRQLAIPQREVHKLEDGIGLHPALNGLKQLYDDGLLGVVQGVGYPNPNRSHFVSTDIWSTADPSLRNKTGWLGRYFDATCTGDAPKPIDGIALTNESPLAMEGERFSPLAFKDANTLRWRAPRGDKRTEDAFAAMNNMDGVPDGREDNPMAAFLQRAALDAQVGAEAIRKAAQGRGPRRSGELASQLNFVARLIAADFPTRVYYVSLGGFDTHTGQAGRHRGLLQQLGDALEDFVAELKEDNLLSRVTIMTFSEFGRRVEQNASGGTDHGAAAPMFLIGENVRQGVLGDHPSLEDLDDGDLKFKVDFRDVYATICREWLRVDPRSVAGVRGRRLKIFR